jgi:uncharacterized protein (DUF2126 family)/transglutaminase-like putative cysteine protease
MAVRVALHHRTCYRYDRLVTLSPQVVRLRPAPHCRTPVTSYSLQVVPQKHFLNWQQDPHGNYLARLVFPEKTGEFSVDVDLVAEMAVINPFDFFLEPDADQVPFRYAAGLATDLRPYCAALPLGPKLGKFMQRAPRAAGRTVDFLVALNGFVHESVRYVIRMEPGVQTCEETLTLGSGSCRDSAWLLVQVLRQLGLAARFVSGYLIQLKPDVKPLEGPPGPTTDFTDLHAWAEVYLPGAGWVGLDPTSGLAAGEGHLPLAATPEPSAAAPISGGVDPCETSFEFHMTVTRLREAPRVTKPYTDEQWQAIDSLGRQVDADLRAGDVRLTMGGEPTFVSIDDMDGPEWNFAAVSPEKRRLADILFRRLADRFATGALLHFGQGKWYPGESLPRWALGCYWRKDGTPIWHDRALIADDTAPGHATPASALGFITALAERLQVPPEHVLPAYEDAWYYLWKEHRLPVNVDPLDANLDDPEERARLAHVFERGLGTPVGYAIPLRHGEEGAEKTWESGAWFLRQEHMYLLPGDSPMGLRLPLGSIPWAAAEDRPQPVERDPFAPRGPLPAGHRSAAGSNGHAARVHEPLAALATASAQRIEMAVREREASAAPLTAPQLGQSAAGLIRTALCVESRAGRLYVFMPPLPRLEDYLDLVTAVEETAAEQAQPVLIEGYPPPQDGRIEHFKVTPDPGVIEVNLQPARDWEELVTFTTTLYEEARQSRLGTEKFMLDGRHTGTGGGNHIVLGGPTPADSPMLRRPDLLRSLTSFWNNRPSLSYMFSGLFVGPTSQAPRVDEARHESLYELETAFSHLPADGDCPPWLIDRALRHLLVDLTGNTHRAEFCIDKLFSPDTATGRLGLVEFRGFEMPPHARLSLAQQLLVRALIAWFWKTPYRQPLVRWGAALHDRFMLPQFVAQDFAEVLDELKRAGYTLDSQWFAPHFEFRFPLVGEVTYAGIRLELRQAIEPWHVLGEERASAGTARYVDSSLERLQVKVQGMTDTRYLLTCNGRAVPLHPTGTPGEFVAGVRYRAWQPPSCLHPTIGVHTPLVFDVVDRWSAHAIGGCTWHVAHPGGLSFDAFPVNAIVAETRRAARFLPMGHTPGAVQLPLPEVNHYYPLTLDLRRPAAGDGATAAIPRYNAQET